jgi:ubiquinol-cytochrome c reductase cytochrome c1 subunit
MKKLIIAFLLALVPLFGSASEGPQLDKANIDLSDQASLQRGAKYFVNYCLSCHSAQFQRYNRMAQDLGLTEDEVMKNLMFTTDKIGDTMTVAMHPADGEKWFGVAPPDLSVLIRARGVDYIYTYLRSFYLDDSRPMGVNNVVFPSASMPDVLWQLQGLQKANFKELEDGKMEFEGFEQVTPGTLSAEEFDQVARDLTAFLSYVGEPVQMKRVALGKWVLLFIAVFFVLSYLLKKEYWKDVH